MQGMNGRLRNQGIRKIERMGSSSSGGSSSRAAAAAGAAASAGDRPACRPRHGNAVQPLRMRWEQKGGGNRATSRDLARILVQYTPLLAFFWGV